MLISIFYPAPKRRPIRPKPMYSKGQQNRSQLIGPAGRRKGPAGGSGPCPMRASPVNARSAALGSSAKLRSKHAGVGKAKMAALVDNSSSSGKGQQISCDSTEEVSRWKGKRYSRFTADSWYWASNNVHRLPHKLRTCVYEPILGETGNDLGWGAGRLGRRRITRHPIRRHRVRHRPRCSFPGTTNTPAGT